jgi:hypothetical protein
MFESEMDKPWVSLKARFLMALWLSLISMVATYGVLEGEIGFSDGLALFAVALTGPLVGITSYEIEQNARNKGQ